jgi:hypothetical protein
MVSISSSAPSEADEYVLALRFTTPTTVKKFCNVSFSTVDMICTDRYHIYIRLIIKHGPLLISFLLKQTFSFLSLVFLTRVLSL